MSERKGAIILLWIIAFGALGFSGYMFFKNEIFGAPEGTDSGLTLVGLWDDLAKNKDYAPYTTDDSWLIEFNNNQFNNSNYISVDNSNTRFKLLKEGYYKITVLFLLGGLDANAIYWVYLYRNSTIDHYFDRISISANPSSPYHQIESSMYVKSTGLDNFIIRCYGFGDTSFTIGTTQAFNQLSIEYNK